VGSCTIAAPPRSYVNCMASSEQIHPAWGLMLRSDGTMLSGVRYVYSSDKQSGKIKRKERTDLVVSHND
jgi:hypothetical protein